MVATAGAVKSTARAALKDNWLKSIIAALIFIFTFFILYIASALLSYVLPTFAIGALWGLFAVFLLAPLGMGLLRFYWRVMWDADDEIITVFHFFSEKEQYIRVIKLAFAYIVKIVYIGFLLFLPSVITEIFSNGRVYEMVGFSAPSWASSLYLVSVFLKSAAVVLLIILMIKYYLAPFFVIADEEMDIWEAMHKSTVLAVATGMDFILLVISLSGWILLSLITIPLPFTLPYFAVSYLVHSRFATANYNKVVKEFDSKGAISQLD
ncbi:MAG: hypothetical protein IKK24_04305 [Clostridia bacterium]|nr:hypothetical protein [Clostridia bacterium]